PSRVVISPTTAPTRASPPLALVSATSLPTAIISLRTPNGPLGLAATTTRAASIGLRQSSDHSSAVKSAFPAMAHLLCVRRVAPAHRVNAGGTPLGQYSGLRSK